MTLFKAIIHPLTEAIQTAKFGVYMVKARPEDQAAYADTVQGIALAEGVLRKLRELDETMELVPKQAVK